jgi:hypothetical protein
MYGSRFASFHLGALELTHIIFLPIKEDGACSYFALEISTHLFNDL